MVGIMVSEVEQTKDFAALLTSLSNITSLILTHNSPDHPKHDDPNNTSKLLSSFHYLTRTFIHKDRFLKLTVE
jgi:hypothetical protein